MDVASIAAAFIAAAGRQLQIAVAAKMLRMNAERGRRRPSSSRRRSRISDRLANVASGLGGNLDITV